MHFDRELILRPAPTVPDAVKSGGYGQRVYFGWPVAIGPQCSACIALG
jgi:hypothetical protein